MIAPTYPGVYVQEVPSGVRTITGAATSLAAFVGRSLRGPVNEPVTLASFGEFERTFGGLWVASSLGFAVRDFFANGGGQAIVVRLFNPLPSESVLAPITLGEGEEGFRFTATSPGAWGAQLRLRIDPVDEDVKASIAERHGVPEKTLFNLRVRDGGTGQEELHSNLTTVSDHARSAQRVLEAQSHLIRCVMLPELGAEGVLPEVALPTGQAPWWSSEATSVAPEFEQTDGAPLTMSSFVGAGSEAAKEGLYALEKVALFNLLCLPPYKVEEANDPGLWQAAATYCERRRALLLIDPDPTWMSASDVSTEALPASENAALYFPALRQANPLRENQIETFAPCGAVAGVIARTDSTRGVWKAPAGLDAAVTGAVGLSVSLNDPEIGRLNPLGVNCLRAAPAAGRVVWGARTMRGDDRLASEWKYIPVRRLALYIEESLYVGTQWAVFEPNDEPLWSQLRLNIGTFMNGLFRRGAFQGSAPRMAYFVQCDRHTTTQADIEQGVVHVVVGFAPVKPAEFVIIKLQQMAGQSVA